MFLEDCLNKKIRDEKERCIKLMFEKSQRLKALQITSDEAGTALQRKSLIRITKKLRVSWIDRNKY